MSKVWSDEHKFQIWLDIEVLACEAMAELGQIPKNDAVEIRKRARFSIPEIWRSKSGPTTTSSLFLKMSLAQWDLQRAGFTRGLRHQTFWIPRWPSS
jgi:Adenylosuccinate lyase